MASYYDTVGIFSTKGMKTWGNNYWVNESHINSHGQKIESSSDFGKENAKAQSIAKPRMWWDACLGINGLFERWLKLVGVFLNYNRYRNDPLVLERTLREGFADQGHYVSRCEMGTPSKWRHCDVIQHQVALVMFPLLEAWHGLIPGNMFQLFWLALQGWKAKTRRNCTWEPEKLRFKKHRSSNVCVAKYDSNMV